MDGYFGESGHVKLAVIPATPPANDHFSTRDKLSGYSAVATGVNTFATRDEATPGSTSLGFTSDGASTLWWEWTAPTNGLVRLNTHASTFDTRLAVLTGLNPGSLKLVQSNDNDARIPGATSRLEFNVSANVRTGLKL